MASSQNNIIRVIRRPDDRDSVRLQRRGLVQARTAAVVQTFKAYDEAARHERDACGDVCDGDDDGDDIHECLEARVRTMSAKERMLAAVRELNDPH